MLGTDDRTSGNGQLCGIFEDSAVKRVELPSTLKRIEYCVFEDCKHLKDINLPEGLTYIGKMCFKDSALSSLAVPAALNSIDNSAFSGCERLKNIEFLEGRTALGTADTGAGVWDRIFRKCRVQTVALPSTLREMMPDIFCGCRSLRTVRVAKGCGVDVRKFVGESVEVLEE